jgi:tetratricopeptide (TPR) repeat protein
MSIEKIFSVRPRLVMLLLAVVTVVAYGHLFTNDFTNFDDDTYILNNLWVQGGLSIDSIRWAFSFDLKDGAYWQPLTWLSLMLDNEFFRLNPVGYHLENLAIHITNALLLFTLLRRMTDRIWSAAFVAALFALHPLNVESVAWAVERKNVLSSLFWMLALLAYAHYTDKPSWKRYCQVFAFMAVGLMAKSMIVSLPCVLLLLDYWPLQRTGLPVEGPREKRNRLRIRRLIAEKIPLFVLSVLSVAVSDYSLKADGKFADRTYLPPLDGRISEALVSYVRYLGKLVWPSELVVYYPPRSAYPEWQIVCAGILLLAITLVKRRPWFIVGWLWFLGVLFPVSGIKRAGLWPAMADRFSYLPFIGIFIIIAWSAPELLQRVRQRRIVLGCAAFISLAALSTLTFIQTGYWKTSRTLFAHALEAGEDNYVFRDNYGHGLFYQGRVQEAMEQYRLALNFRPDYAKAHFNMGAALDLLGRTDEATAEYRKALRLDPSYSSAHNNLGLRLAEKGRYEEAKQHFLAALRTRPNDPNTLFNLGLALFNQGNLAEAEMFFAEAVRLRPDFVKARSNLGSVLGSERKYREAVVQFEEVLKYMPDDQETRRNLEFSRMKLAGKN